jgi:hypothetical protein
MNGQRVLDQVIRTQAALATPGFDLDLILKDVADEARALTGAETAVVEMPSGRLITSRPRLRPSRHPQSALVVALPDTGDRGALRVYAAERCAFGTEAILALELFARLVSSALIRAALPAAADRPRTP